MTSLYDDSIYQVRNSAVPLAAFWLAALVFLSVAEHQHWLPAWLLVLICAPPGALAVMHFYHAYLRLSWSTRTYKAHLPALARRMTNLFPKLARYRTDSTKIVTHFVLVGIGLALSISLQAYSAVLVSVFLGGTALTASLRAVLPPGGVYLASSSPDRIQLFSQLSLRTIPAFAALLEVSNLVNRNDGSLQFLKGAIGVVNDYRTTDPAAWTSVVQQLVEMAAVVLVDGRDETPGVKFEVERIIRNRLDFKTTFISQDGSMPPILKALGAKTIHPSGKFQIMTPDMALQAIPLIIKEAHAYWIPVRMDA